MTITKSTQSMVSIFGIMGSIIQGTTSWTSCAPISQSVTQARAGIFHLKWRCVATFCNACEDRKYLSERFGARQMQIYSNGGPGTPFGGLVNQFEPFTYALFPGFFPLLFFWQIHDAFMGAHRKRFSHSHSIQTLVSSQSVSVKPRSLETTLEMSFLGALLHHPGGALRLTGGFGAAAGYTLQFDILPVGPDGRPKSAARDMSVQATASTCSVANSCKPPYF